MTDPYAIPHLSPDFSEIADRLGRRRRFWFRAIWVSPAGVIVPPVVGVAGTVSGMRKAFGGLSDSGIGDPAALSSHISSVLVYTAAGLAVSVIALVVLIGALIRFFTLPKVPDQTPQNSMHNKSRHDTPQDPVTATSSRTGC